MSAFYCSCMKLMKMKMGDLLLLSLCPKTLLMVILTTREKFINSGLAINIVVPAFDQVPVNLKFNHCCIVCSI